MSRSAVSVKAEHDEGHRPTEAFDFYCVAHDGEYAPKYLNGGVCHGGFDDNLCHPECAICPVPCPHKPCPRPWDDE